MRCEFTYCIYNKGLVCILDEIAMNSLGQCDDCIMVAIPDDKLEKYKAEQLQALLKRHSN